MATLTAEDARKIANLHQSDGRHALLETLQWPAFDEDKHMQKSIHLDFLYDSLMFFVEKGFNWDRVANVVTFADRILHQIKKSDSITEILGFYNGSSASLLDVLGERDFKIFTAYIFETVLPHFKLYKFVFTTERQEQIPNVKLRVEPPFESDPLKETKPIKVWEYEKQIQTLENKENERRKQKVEEMNKKLSELDDQAKQELKSTIETTKSVDKESIGKIIQDAARQFTMSTTELLKFGVVKLQDDLEFKLEKTCVPRPQALGPPPRYNVQQQKVPSSKAPKSPKAGSRASVRSKKK